MENILKSFAEGSLKIGDIIKEKASINKLADLWMDVQDKQKISVFLKAAEEDPELNSLTEFVKQIPAPVLPSEDKDISLKLAHITSTLDMFLRFIAMAYIGLKVGLNEKSMGEIIEIIGCYRIGDWHLDDYKSVVAAFSLEDMVERWDGETALCKPIDTDEKSGKLVKKMTCHNYYWDFYYRAWNEIIEYYLLEKEKIISPKEISNFLQTLYRKDEILQKIDPKIQPFLNEILAVDNIFLIDEKQLFDIANVLRNYSEEKSFLKDGVLAIITDFGGPHQEKGWDVRINSSVIHVFSKGKMYRQELSPYFEYEDYPGGQTYHRNSLNAQKIVAVSEPMTVTIEMKDASKMVINPKETFSFTRNRNIGEREKYFNDTLEIWVRSTYEGNPEDLNFSF